MGAARRGARSAGGGRATQRLSLVVVLFLPRPRRYTEILHVCHIRCRDQYLIGFALGFLAQSIVVVLLLRNVR